jgi:hypothetical protein
MVGAFVGAVNGALQVLHAETVNRSADPELLGDRPHRAASVALRAWT